MPVESARLQKLLATVDLETAFGVRFNGSSNVNAYCPFHEDPSIAQSKSASVSLEGLFKCHGCSAAGDVFDFYARAQGVTRGQAVEALRGTRTGGQPSQPVHKMRKLSGDMVDICQDMLQDNQTFLNYLYEERGLADSTIERFKIGCDERRITIPIFDIEGQLVNIRRYLPHASSSPKMLSFAKGYGQPRLYPIDILAGTPLEERIILCEGEWDALLLNQYHIPAVSVTAGVTTWNSTFTAAFADREVAIIYDVNDKDDIGQRVAWERARVLRSVGASVRIVTLPLDPDKYRGGDVTNYLVGESKSPADLVALIDEAATFELPSEIDDSPGGGGPPNGSPLEPPSGGSSPASYHHTKDAKVYPCTLDQASHSKFFFKRITFSCIVAGKGIAPYLPPRHVSVEIVGEDGSSQTVEKIFDVWDGAILSLIQCSEARLKTFLRSLLGVPKSAISKITIVDTFNIEEVYLIPAIDHENDQGPYVMRKCYYAGHGLQTNRTYQFEGYTLPDPRSQAATHILTSAAPMETDLDTFKLEPKDAQQLRATFTPADGDIDGRFTTIAADLSEHVTHIYGRTDLHTAIDLVFHSPLAFEFDGVMVHKGWLEVLILGDTRTGKGFVTEGMCKHYGVGEVVSGENITLAGLIGGIQRVGDRWTLVWGKIPLADKRLIVMDEAGALHQEDIGRMSRIRSEGVAEITKIISEKTTARTRLIWLANPRPRGETKKRMIVDYNYGIQAVPELIGAAEDIARFDYAMIVAHNEVDAKVINRRHLDPGPQVYTAELCHKLVMWSWSRRPDQIVFAPGVTQTIMTMAMELAKQFTPKIPLVQGEDVRFKLARIAVSAANRTFSTDATFEKTVVLKEHAAFAYNFLHAIYSKPSCGYDQLSVVDREQSTLRDPQAVESILRDTGELIVDLVDGLLEHRQITAADLCDYAAIDRWVARSIIGQLVRARALIKEYSWYVKKPAFREFLYRLKMTLRGEEHTTQPDEEIN